jgi:peptide-methionine (S)-S-oxide reductase
VSGQFERRIRDQRQINANVQDAPIFLATARGGPAIEGGRRHGPTYAPYDLYRTKISKPRDAASSRSCLWTLQSKEGMMSDAIEKAVLAGGCFWGMQDLFRKRPGVISTRVGYSGGNVSNATYRRHGNHAEAIEISFDPDVTTYRDLLEFFFQVHDPTTANRQGNDQGESYRSAIFYLDDEQRRIAQDTVADVNASGLWPGPVVTELSPAGAFWEAEPEHQDYLEHYPNGYTCHFARPDWVLPRRNETSESTSDSRSSS